MISAPATIKRLGSKDSAISQAFKAIDQETCEVNLAGKSIGDSHINEIINNLKKITSTRGIDLSSNRISDEGVQHLAKGVAEHGQL